MSEVKEVKLYGPSRWWTFIYGVLGFSFIVLAVLIVITNVMSAFNALPLAFFGLPLLWFTYDRQINKRPQLILTVEGIEWQSSSKKSKFYTWEDVGAFKLFKGISMPLPNYGAGACKSENPRILNDGSNTSELSFAHIDIYFPIYNLDIGFYKADQQKIVDEINDWRERYGSGRECE